MEYFFPEILNDSTHIEISDNYIYFKRKHEDYTYPKDVLNLCLRGKSWRDEEINRINFKRMNQKNNEVLKQDSQGNYYLDINNKNIGKFKSDPGIVYIDKTTATMLKDFIEGGGDLKGAATNIGKKLPSDSNAPFKDLRKRIQTLSVTNILLLAAIGVMVHCIPVFV